MKKALLLIALFITAPVFAVTGDTAPFQPAGPVHQISVTSSASTAVQVVPTNSGFSGCLQYKMENTGSTDVWVGFGASASSAETNAADIPAPGDTGVAVLVKALTSSVVTNISKAYVSTKTASGTSTLNIGCGVGVLSGVTSSTGPIGTAGDPVNVTFPTTDPCQSSGTAKSSVVINNTANAQLVALSGTTVVYVCGWALTMAGTAPSYKFITGTGTVCATGMVDKTGTFLPVSAAQFSAYGAGTIFKGAAGEALCITIAGTTPSAQGVLTYVQQ